MDFIIVVMDFSFESLCNLVVFTSTITCSLVYSSYSFVAASGILNYSDTFTVPSVCNTLSFLIILKCCPAFNFVQQLVTKGWRLI